MNTFPLLCITGPTAIGKTGMALEIADQYPVELISVDSALVYRQLTIGANKPTPEELARHPHHLVDIVDVTDGYNVQAFLVGVEQAIQTIINRGKIPVLVGGTMMYFYQFIHGLADIPPVPPEALEVLQKRKENAGLASLYEELQEVDPIWANKIDPNDPQRIFRGLAVYWSSGRPLSSFFDEKAQRIRPVKMLALTPESKEEHWGIIHQRLYAMLKQGFIEEVEALWKEYPDQSLEFWRFVGYRQLLPIFTEQLSRATAIEQAYYATNQLAKRQKTWLNKFEATSCPVHFKNNRAICDSFQQHVHDYFLKNRF